MRGFFDEQQRPQLFYAIGITLESGSDLKSTSEQNVLFSSKINCVLYVSYYNKAMTIGINTPLKDKAMKRIKAIIFAMSILGSMATLSNSSASSLTEIIQSLGFQPLNTPISDFTIENVLTGQNTSLSSNKGKWVWMTFFATWCGACGIQMPFLETFHIRFKNEGIKVLAISIDEDDKGVVLSYLKKKDLTFEVLHDANHKAASLYQAQSIPTTYLISPDQKIAGVARGAINWASPENIAWAEKLIQFDRLEGAGNTANLRRQENDLPPPTLEITSPRQMTFTGQYNFELTITMPSDSRDYIIKVPTLKVPDGIVIKNVASESKGSKEPSHLIYRYDLHMKEPGKYLLGPIELEYQDRRTMAPQDMRHEAIEVDLFPSDNKELVLALGAIVFFLLVGGLSFLFLNKNVENQAIIAKEREVKIRKEQNLQVYKDLQKIKLSGNSSQYASELLKLLCEINPQNTIILSAVRDKIRFSGLTLSDVELKQYEKMVEKDLSTDES